MENAANIAIASSTDIVVSVFTTNISSIFIIFGASVGFYVILRVLVGLLSGDNSYQIHGFYLKNTPYAGYNRFRSRKWNMKHTA